jgi:hypothetical protein
MLQYHNNDISIRPLKWKNTNNITNINKNNNYDYVSYHWYLRDTSKPVYCHPMGGIGNQLFIVSTALAFSIKHNKPLKIIDYIPQFKHTDHRPSYSNTFFKSIQKCFIPSSQSPTNRQIITEPMLYSNDNKIPNSNILLQGYFQYPNYFDSIKPQIYKSINYHTIK